VPSRRRSKISEIALLLTCAACGGAGLDTQLELKDATRKPDGVLVEPAPAIPNAEEHGSTQSGVVALRQPIGAEQIGELVLKYVGAFAADDVNAFSELFENDAVLFGDNGRSAPRVTIIQNFQQREQQHRAEFARVHDVARLDRMVQWTSDDLGPHTDPPRPAEMRAGDVYARVPLQSPLSQAGDPLYRNTLVLLVRRSADHTLKIAGVAETDTP
jgi:hypothetical protein